MPGPEPCQEARAVEFEDMMEDGRLAPALKAVTLTVAGVLTSPPSSDAGRVMTSVWRRLKKKKKDYRLGGSSASGEDGRSSKRSAVQKSKSPYQLHDQNRF